MQVAKWGNSLAVRLPAKVVEALALKDGDDIEITIAGTRTMRVSRQPSTSEALSALRRLRGAMPAGFKYDRELANDR